MNLLPNLSSFHDDSVNAVDCETTRDAYDNGGRDNQEENYFDPDILEDDEKVDKETGDKYDESTVEKDPGKYEKMKIEECSPECEEVGHCENDADGDGQSKLFRGILHDNVTETVLENLILECFTVVVNVFEDDINILPRLTYCHDESNQKQNIDQSKNTKYEQ